MKNLKKKLWDNYQKRLVLYAISTLCLGAVGIYTLTHYMEEYTIASKIERSLDQGQMPSQKEIVKLIQHFPAKVKEVLFQAVKEGMTEDEAREVYAYYKEYNNIKEK